jgi:hypothetical protein
MKYAIKFLHHVHRDPLEVKIPTGTAERYRLREALESAVRADADLSGADLEEAYLACAHLDGAHLSGAYLVDANLMGADLEGADLVDARLGGAYLAGAYLARANFSGASLDGAGLANADLVGANLARASLGGAYLVGANLSRACLEDANLAGADLTRANLVGANLRGANLDGANLRGADLRPIKADLFDLLLRARAEIPALLAALRAGQIDGSTYTGPCACLVGTIARERGVHHDSLGVADRARPIERWVLGISAGDTPETHQIAKITASWIEEFVALIA